MDPDVVKVTEVYLAPTSILIGAFAIASTEPLKTGLSFVCTVIASMWLTCVIDAWPSNASLRIRVMATLPVLFLMAAVLSTIVHAIRWCKGL